MAMMLDQDLLTVDEAAAALRLSYASTLAMIRRGDLPAARVGRPFRIRKAALDEALRRLEHQEPSPPAA